MDSFGEILGKMFDGALKLAIGLIVIVLILLPLAIYGGYKLFFNF